MIPRHLQIAFALLALAIAAAAIYIVQLKQREERRLHQAVAAQSSTLATPVPPSAVQLAIAYDDDGAIRLQRFQFALPPEPTERARELLRALLAEYQKSPSPHPVPPGADVRDVYLLASTSGGRTAVVDINAALADAHRSGVLVENLTLASIIGTLKANFPDLTDVRLLVDGEERPTLAGHADLTRTYATTEIDTMVKVIQ